MGFFSLIFSEKNIGDLKLASHAIPICGSCAPCGGPRGGQCEFPRWCHLEDEVDKLGIRPGGWFRNPAKQLRLVVYCTICKFLCFSLVSISLSGIL